MCNCLRLPNQMCFICFPIIIFLAFISFFYLPHIFLTLYILKHFNLHLFSQPVIHRPNMTCFGQLPFVILNHILRIAIDTEDRTLNVWADNLPLLGVCREWRKVAVRLVYCCAILEGSSELSNGFVEHSEDKIVENKLIHTNIGLIKATGNTHLVKTLFFKANKYQYCQSLVDNVHSIFSFEKCDWSGVSEIVTNGWLAASDNDGDESHSNIARDAQQFAELIAENMPNVSKLDTWTSDKDGLRYSIVNMLYTYYSRSLWHISVNQQLLLAESVCFRQLATLDVDLHLSQTIPRICRHHLQSLTLRNITKTFTWHRMANFGEANDIVFPNLLSLKMEYSHELDINSINLLNKACFPALECLDINVPKLDMLKYILDYKNEDHQFPNVVKLCIDVDKFSGDVFDITNKNQSGVLAARFKQYIPKVTHIKLGSDVSGNAEDHFYNELANLYFDQLVRIEFGHPTTFTAPQFSRELTHLTLNAGSNTLQKLPSLFAESLKYLKLTNLDFSFTWDMLQGESMSNTLNFRMLEYMHVYFKQNIEEVVSDHQQFIDTQKTQHSKITVVCPRLKKLRINNASINMLQNILCCGASQWYNMRDMGIRFNMRGFELIQNVINVDDYMNAISVFARYIIEKMPHINALDMFSFSNGEDNINYLCSILSNSYAYQLNSFNSNIPIKPTANEYSPKLRSLNINVDKANTALLPKINAANIEDINLRGNLDCFSWKTFTSKAVSNDITFGNLKGIIANHTDLELTRAVENNDAFELAIRKHPLILNMPKLRNIVLININDDSKLYNTTIEFKHIHDFDIDGSYKTLYLFKDSKAGIIDSCNIHLKLKNGDDENDFYKTTNKFFGDAIKFKHVELSLMVDLPKWNTQLISWTNVNNLDICLPIHFDTLLNLFAKVPRLSVLIVNDILCDEVPETILDQVEPICANVSELHLIGGVITESENMESNCIKYLLLSLQSLKTVPWMRVNFNSDAFVEQYKNEYPHVLDIEFI